MNATDVIDRVWADVTTRVEPTLTTALLALGAVVACLVVPALWGTVRHVVTVAHEGGHAVVAVLTGRRVSSVTLHADTSGATTSLGNQRRLPLALVAFAGYPAPSVVGVGAAALVGSGYGVAMLWACVAALLVILVRIRNVFGFLVMVVLIAALAASAWFLPGPWQAGIASALVWLLLLGAVRAVVELGGTRVRGGGSDADALARLTRIPAPVWVAVFWLVTVCGAVVGAWWMLGELLSA